ncbi:MAG: hypothetical protein ACMUIE_05070, partial [Thermoplasmatota archaeon]
MDWIPVSDNIKNIGAIVFLSIILVLFIITIIFVIRGKDKEISSGISFSISDKRTLKEGGDFKVTFVKDPDYFKFLQYEANNYHVLMIENDEGKIEGMS